MSDLETQLGDQVAEGRITVEVADTVREFAEFLRFVGPPEGPATQRRRLAFLERAGFVGLTDEERERLQARYDRGVAEGEGDGR